MMYFANNGTLVISDKGRNSAYKLAAGAKIENLLEHGGASFPHIVKEIDYETFMHEFNANDDVWEKISQTENESHFNKMQESSHVVEAVNQFGSKMGSIKDNIVNSMNSAFTFIEEVIIIIVIIISIGATIKLYKWFDNKRKNNNNLQDYFRPRRAAPSAPVETFKLSETDHMLLAALKQ